MHLKGKIATAPCCKKGAALITACKYIAYMPCSTCLLLPGRYIDIEGSSQAPVVTGHSQSITCLALPEEPSMSMMASTSQDGILHIWQLPSSPDSWHQVAAGLVILHSLLLTFRQSSINCPFICSFTHHSFAPSLIIRSFILSFIHTLTHSFASSICMFNCLFVQSLIHSHLLKSGRLSRCSRNEMHAG